MGSDSRAFVKDAVAADHFGTPKTNPENLADVIMIAHIDPNAPGKGFLVSIPRDTWVPIPGHGTQKIDAAFNFGNGAVRLTQTIEQDFKFTINHYLKLDFATFRDVVADGDDPDAAVRRQPDDIRAASTDELAQPIFASSTAAAMHARGFANGGTATDADRGDYQYTLVRISTAPGCSPRAPLRWVEPWSSSRARTSPGS